MTILNTFTNGTLADATEVNANFLGVISRKQFSDATLRTHTGDTNWTDSGTSFTFTATAGAMILSMHLKCQMKIDGAATAYATLKITGATITDTYGDNQLLFDTTGTFNTYAETWHTAESGLLTTDDTSFVNMAATMPPLTTPDASTTIDVRISTNDGARTVSIQNVTLDILYVDGFVED